MGPGASFIGDEEIKEVLEVLRARQLSRYSGNEQRPSKTDQFERSVERLFDVRHCIAMNSCTSALLAGFAALGIGPGDEVLVPGYAFVASLAAIVYSGATPVLVEIDDSLTLDPDDAESKVTPRTKAILAVHMLGEPCDMTRIAHVAARHGLFVVEDVAQACGGSFAGRRLGSIGRIGAFSLNVFKTITSGDGGMLTTQDASLYRRAFAFHDHGYEPFRADAVDSTDSNNLIGLNLRMNELAGAVALAQVRKLEMILRRLRANKQAFLDALRSRVDLPLRRSNDPTGECATTVSCVFPDETLARDVAEAIGAVTAIHTGKHYYGSMREVIGRRTPSPRYPFASSSSHDGIDYRRGVLPTTDDILSRTVHLSVGVRDGYLGTSFGIQPLSSLEAIDHTALEFIRRTRGLL